MQNEMKAGKSCNELQQLTKRDRTKKELLKEVIEMMIFNWRVNKMPQVPVLGENQ